MAANGISTEVSGDGSNTAATKLKRRNDKLALAQAKRQAVGTPGYRQYNVYETPGTVAPAEGRPWLFYPSTTPMNLLSENGDYLITEDGDNLVI